MAWPSVGAGINIRKGNVRQMKQAPGAVVRGMPIARGKIAVESGGCCVRSGS
jgi:hypothetical protein